MGQDYHMSTTRDVLLPMQRERERCKLLFAHLGAHQFCPMRCSLPSFIEIFTLVSFSFPSESFSLFVPLSDRSSMAEKEEDGRKEVTTRERRSCMGKEEEESLLLLLDAASGKRGRRFIALIALQDPLKISPFSSQRSSVGHLIESSGEENRDTKHLAFCKERGF